MNHPKNNWAQPAGATLWRGKQSLALPGILAGMLGLVLFTEPAFAQATATVKPRQYVLWNGLLTAKQAITTNAALPGQNIGVFTNTLIPFTGSHAIGITGIIQTTNALAGASNMVVSVYQAMDVGGGNAFGIGPAYGTNFATAPLTTYTWSYSTNAIVTTNIATAVWEPATSLGFTISNGCNSNTTFALIMSVAP
jgi:hypothetical protein